MGEERQENVQGECETGGDVVNINTDVFHETFENLTRHAYGLQRKCWNIIRECYGNDPITLPIDIGRIVRFRGIKLEFKDLNLGGGDEIDLNIAHLQYDATEDNLCVEKIYVDNGDGKSYSASYSNLTRYAIAYELSKTIINEKSSQEMVSSAEVNRRNMTSVPYSLPRLYASLERFEYEMCAIFLLIPLDMFLEEFDSYIEGIREQPILLDKWIEHLSVKTQIPNYQLFNGYPYIKFCAYQYYKERTKDINNKYWKLFR